MNTTAGRAVRDHMRMLHQTAGDYYQMLALTDTSGHAEMLACIHKILAAPAPPHSDNCARNSYSNSIPSEAQQQTASDRHQLPLIHDSWDLLAGRDEVIIQHAGTAYRLQRTTHNGLTLRR